MEAFALILLGLGAAFITYNLGIISNFGLVIAGVGIIVVLLYFSEGDGSQSLPDIKGVLPSSSSSSSSTSGEAPLAKVNDHLKDRFKSTIMSDKEPHKVHDKLKKYDFKGEEHQLYGVCGPVSPPSKDETYFPGVVYDLTADERIGTVGDIHDPGRQKNVFSHPTFKSLLKSEGYTKRNEDNDAPAREQNIIVGGDHPRQGESE